MKKIVLLLIILLSASAASSQSERSECFPFERLTAAERPRAEELLLKALDSEALYTIVGGLKPMSSGFASFQTSVREPRGMTPAEADELLNSYKTEDSRKNFSDDEKRRFKTAQEIAKRRDALTRIEETRKFLALWRCGENSFFAEVQHFAKPFEGVRHSEAVVFNATALRAMLAERATFFSRWAITPSSHPLQVLFAVENDDSGSRFGGYGYLFGYPNHAVNFFVTAAGEEEFTGKFVERDFYSVPTFARPTNGFVWAVPKGHVEIEADRAIKAKADRILSQYKVRRAQYIGPGTKGVVNLLRDWLCESNSKCSTASVDVRGRNVE